MLPYKMKNQHNTPTNKGDIATIFFGVICRCLRSWTCSKLGHFRCSCGGLLQHWASLSSLMQSRSGEDHLHVPKPIEQFLGFFWSYGHMVLLILKCVFFVCLGEVRFEQPKLQGSQHEITHMKYCISQPCCLDDSMEPSRKIHCDLLFAINILRSDVCSLRTFQWLQYYHALALEGHLFQSQWACHGSCGKFSRSTCFSGWKVGFRWVDLVESLVEFVEDLGEPVVPSRKNQGKYLGVLKILILE